MGRQLHYCCVTVATYVPEKKKKKFFKKSLRIYMSLKRCHFTKLIWVPIPVKHDSCVSSKLNPSVLLVYWYISF